MLIHLQLSFILNSTWPAGSSNRKCPNHPLLSLSGQSLCSTPLFCYFHDLCMLCLLLYCINMLQAKPFKIKQHIYIHSLSNGDNSCLSFPNPSLHCSCSALVCAFASSCRGFLSSTGVFHPILMSCWHLHPSKDLCLGDCSGCSSITSLPSTPF